VSNISKKLEEELEGYIHRVKNKNNSEAKILQEFTSFIQKVFGIEAKDLDFEVSVKSHVKQLKGRMDATFSNIILEFKKDLTDERALNTAEGELEKYFQSQFEKLPKVKFLGIATDGVNFRVYQPIFKDNQIEKLEKINEINFNSSSLEIILNWFDSFFLGDPHKKIPTSEILKQSFGLNSPTYGLIRQELTILFQKIEEDKKIKIKFENWSRFLEIVYGEKPKEINLFVAHTYLSTFVKILVYLKLSKKDQRWNIDISEILNGKIFSKYKIKNFVEDDFFTWLMHPLIKKESTIIFKNISKNLELYDLDLIDGDILKELYQEMVHPQIRKQLGEFYTPDWLAEKIVDEALNNEPKKSVLDPSCGSGTFLLKTIEYKIKKLQKLKLADSEILEHILENVMGFDIHPLAALISKTNYLLGLKNIIHARKGVISIPVYLSDSLKIPDKENDATNSVTTFGLTTHISNKKFTFPSSMTDSIGRIDQFTEIMKDEGDKLDKKIQTEKKIKGKINNNIYKEQLSDFKESILEFENTDDKNILINNVKTLFQLITEESDSIWPYIIRNMYKPLAISFKKVDVILGNPPWLALQFMKNSKYQNYLKNQSKKYNLVDTKNMQNIAHLELATLFFCQCTDNFLKKNGSILFVMPRSVLISSQHKNFLKFKTPLIQLKKIIDLNDVSPIFKIPSCVLIAKQGFETKYPITKISFKGNLKSTHESLKSVSNKLQSTESDFNFEVENKVESEYMKKFYSGASIYPRIFWIINFQTNDSFGGFDPEKPFVVSEKNNNSKPPWNGIVIEGNVEKKFIFDTILATDIVHFGNLRNRLIVLPILENKGKYEIVSDSNDKEIKNLEISKYLKQTEVYWKNNATAKSKEWSVYRRLNYNSDLVRQNPSSKYRVLYIVSGTYLTSCVVDLSKKFTKKIEKNKFTSSGNIVDYTNYYYDTNSKYEAYYLSSVLNSKILDDLIKPEQVRGAFGPRHISKIPLKFPIPEFDKNNESHEKLSLLGILCHEKVEKLLPTLNYRSTGKIRNVIRKTLEDDINEINELVKKIL
jgi:hypothetical protein